MPVRGRSSTQPSARILGRPGRKAAAPQAPLPHSKAALQVWTARIVWSKSDNSPEKRENSLELRRAETQIAA